MIRDELNAFKVRLGVTTKGKLSVVVQLTRAFASDELPIDPDEYMTDREGQVKGLSGANLKSILESHGITRTLSREGGRTSRGSIELMRAYASLINGFYAQFGEVDFPAIEGYWIEQVKAFFAAQPFKLLTDPAKSIDSVIENLIGQARKREAEGSGTTYAGTVLQHLVAAKLSLIVPELEVNGADVADAPTGRGGDFMIGDVVIHCTTMPGQALIDKCKDNIEAGIRPVIITIRDRVSTARDLAEDTGISDRVEVWDIQQFISTNTYEHGHFSVDKRRDFINAVIVEYNDIIDKYESDPSLRIRID